MCPTTGDHKSELLLPDQDSNLDKQNQNLSYYLYTIGQFTASNRFRETECKYRAIIF